MAPGDLAQFEGLKRSDGIYSQERELDGFTRIFVEHNEDKPVTVRIVEHLKNEKLITNLRGLSKGPAETAPTPERDK